jgi:CRP/FNR family transcriptional regulator
MNKSNKLLCFDLLEDDDLSELLSHQREEIFRKNEILTSNRINSDFVLLISDGLLIHQIAGESNKKLNIRVVGANDFIGLHSIFGQSGMDSTFFALTDVRSFIFPTKILKTYIEKNSKFAFKLVQKTLSAKTEILQVLARLQFKQINGKLAQTLLYLNQFGFNEQSVFNFLKRNDIAQFSGISPTNVVKLLKDFEKAGYIELSKKHIEIVNKDALTSLSAKG